MKILGEKPLLTLRTKHPKITNWNKKWHKFLFSHFFVVPQYGNEKFMQFFPLIRDWDNKD